MRPGGDADDLPLDGLLLQREKNVLRTLCKAYRARTGTPAEQDRNLVIHLGDSVKRKCWSANGKIPTFRTGSGKMWSTSRHRWLTGREKMACLGLPVTNEVAAAMGVHCMPHADVQRCHHVCGNSFHLSSVAVVELVALLSFKLRPRQDCTSPCTRERWLFG